MLAAALKMVRHLVNEFIDESHMRKISLRGSTKNRADDIVKVGNADDDPMLNIEEIEEMLLIANHRKHPQEFDPGRLACLQKNLQKREQQEREKKQKEQKRQQQQKKKLRKKKMR
jgi:hypothetical protein